MVPPDDPSTADIEHRDHGLRPIGRHRDHVPVISILRLHLLLLGDLKDAGSEIPPLRRLLEIKLRRCLFHPLCQKPDHRLVAPAQEADSLVHLSAVFLLGDIAHTGRLALTDLIVQTRPLLPLIPRQIPRTVTNLEQLPHQLDRVPDRTGALERTEVPGAILPELSCKQHPGVSLPYRHLYVRVCLVILQKRIVLWPMLLDQIVLKNQRLQLGVGHDVLKICDLRDHILNLRSAIELFNKILVYPAPEINCFPDIQNRIGLVVHDVDAWFLRKLPQLLLQIKMKLILHSPSCHSYAASCRPWRGD